MVAAELAATNGAGVGVAVAPPVTGAAPDPDPGLGAPAPPAPVLVLVSMAVLGAAPEPLPSVGAAVCGEPDSDLAPDGFAPPVARRGPRDRAWPVAGAVALATMRRACSFRSGAGAASAASMGCAAAAGASVDAEAAAAVAVAAVAPVAVAAFRAFAFASAFSRAFFSSASTRWRSAIFRPRSSASSFAALHTPPKHTQKHAQTQAHEPSTRVEACPTVVAPDRDLRSESGAITALAVLLAIRTRRKQPQGPLCRARRWAVHPPRRQRRLLLRPRRRSASSWA